MLLDLAHKQLGWPRPELILQPTGAGPRVYLKLANQKIGDELRRRHPENGIRVGVLSPDPAGDPTESPLAIVCQFDQPASQALIGEAHRLAWNFSRSRLLVTLEPHLIRSWTCCEPPSDDSLISNQAEITEVRSSIEITTGRLLNRSLHWIELISGTFFATFKSRFRKETCADELLLVNLRSLRDELTKQKLNHDISHDLLARIIFVQFLFDRKDSAGNAALNDRVLLRLFDKGLLSKRYKNFGDILAIRTDAYRLFHWLNHKFNGDLFPGKGRTKPQRDSEWRAEMDFVTQKHLETLANFVGGKTVLKGGQGLLWRHYSFDVIPLEFISSIYEEFVSKSDTSVGAHYTRPYVVDVVLDTVLPWNHINWNRRILDPSCGSGVFLVKAFQRLVHRWRLAHPSQEPKVDVLRNLLLKNIFGVDSDPHAVRVASFSLYLAMCDEIDPRRYWKDVKFPRLRGVTLVHSDFFEEGSAGFDSDNDSKSYDLIIGNAPWGKDTVTAAAKAWALRDKESPWPIMNEGIGTLFLAKAGVLAKRDAHVAMLQPAALLFNDTGTANQFRGLLFRKFKVEQIINLSALRFHGLFEEAVSPSCVVTFRVAQPTNDPIIYICPKPNRDSEDYYRITVDPQDINFVEPTDAASDGRVWTALAWGGQRDYEFVRRLAMRTTLAKLETQRKVKTRRGVSRGDQKLPQPEILGMPYLQDDSELKDGFLTLDAKSLPKNTNPFTHSADSVDMSAFQLPQLIVKQSWHKQSGRFHAYVVRSDSETGAVFCDRSYFSVHAADSNATTLDAACLAINSSVAVYYLLLTSGRFASYIPEPNKADLMEVPIPSPKVGLLDGLRSSEDVDRKAIDAFNLKGAERSLISDLTGVTLWDFLGGLKSPGALPTSRETESELRGYCQSFLQVLRAAYGEDKDISATIYTESDEYRLPLRMVSFHLASASETEIKQQFLTSGEIRSRLGDFYEAVLSSVSRDYALYFQRVARHFDVDPRGGFRAVTIWMVKPDRYRYWTNSLGLRDGDEVFADLMESRKQYIERRRGRAEVEV